MTKAFLRLSGAVLVVFWVLLAGDGVFALGTDCDRCHANFKGVTTPGNPEESRVHCAQCHGSVSAGNNGRHGSTPYVYQTTNTDLAGGNFFYVGTKGDRCGHNVEGFGDIPPDSMDTPGLADGSLDFRSSRLTCAGKYGCHGDRSIVSPREAMHAAHHAYDPTKPCDGKTVATSYRFLLGVTGREMNEDGYRWEYKVTSEKHNGYQGSNTLEDPKSISYLCTQCHGKRNSFHGIGAHPANAILPPGEYDGYSEYSPTVPVARIDFESVGNETRVSSGSGNDVVMCLTCHRAHGSPYASILRFEYDQDDMGFSGSCRTCHRNH